MKEIANTGLLVSVHLSGLSSHLEVFDVSRKRKAKKVYSDEIVKGGRILVKHRIIIILGSNYGDVTYNSRRGMLGAISVGQKTAYHLYNVTTGKTGNTVKLIRKSRWHTQYVKPLDGSIT